MNEFKQITLICNKKLIYSKPKYHAVTLCFKINNALSHDYFKCLLSTKTADMHIAYDIALYNKKWLNNSLIVSFQLCTIHQHPSKLIIKCLKP